MSSAVKLILGVSILATAAGYGACSSGGSSGGSAGATVVPVAGSPSTSAGSGGTSAGGTSGVTAGSAGTPTGTSAGAAGSSGGAPGTGGGSSTVMGVPLTMLGGWVSGMGNTLGIQGAVFPYSDPYSAMGLMSNLKASTDPTMPNIAPNACISGTAAKVDVTAPACVNKMFMSPGATDCYGEFWGVAVGINLNQPMDPVTGMGVMTPLPYDASALKGFAFNISGNTVPASAALRFKVDDGPDEFCTPSTIKLIAGTNTVLFTDLYSACYQATYMMNPNATTIQSKIVKIAWQVVTNTTSAVPFDFCVDSVVAIPK